MPHRPNPYAYPDSPRFHAQHIHIYARGVSNRQAAGTAVGDRRNAVSQSDRPIGARITQHQRGARGISPSVDPICFLSLSLSLVLYIYSVSSLHGGSLGYFWFCKMATPAVVCGAGKLGGEVRVGVEINALSGQ